MTAALPTVVRAGAGWMSGAMAATITVIAAAASVRFVEEPIHCAGLRLTVRGWFASRPRTVWRGDLVGNPARRGTHRRDGCHHRLRPELQAGFPGIQIDAVVSRQLSSALAIVQGMRDSGTLRPVLLIGLGTNGPIDRQSLEQIPSIVGPRHDIVVVNVHAPRGWSDEVNDILTRFAQQYSSVGFAHWRAAISSRLELLARDQIHPGSAGGVIDVRAVTDALQRLAELPPSHGPNDFGLAGVPL